MGHTDFALNPKDVRGEPSPFAIGSKKVAMWLFIIADAVTFAVMLFSYGYLRHAATDWPHPFKVSPSILNVAWMTFVLLSSSVSMVFALRAARKGNKDSAIRWIGITVFSGILFAALHLREWLGLIDEGLRMFHNPWGTPLFGALFFSVTGFHLAHVLSGVVILTVVGIGYYRDTYATEELEVWALYWYFVDVVWMFVMPSVYLLSAAR